MLISELTRLGDKIDIQLLQQLEQQKNSRIEGTIRTYKSSVFDYLSDTEIEIAMPTENGRMVLFQIGLRCRLLFYTKKGLYTCNAVVKRRYKKENFFVLAVTLISEPEKFQRREFFRIDCMINMQYLHITEEVAKLSSTESLFAELQNPEYLGKNVSATALDISGGGLRFSTEERMENGSYIVAILRLINERIDQNFYLVTRVISSDKAADSDEKYMNRGQFMFKDLKDREAIVRFVFDEERRIRRKEIG
jgi:c-di-GMP-binding flagellar brake protein YcgR